MSLAAPFPYFGGKRRAASIVCRTCDPAPDGDYVEFLERQGHHEALWENHANSAIGSTGQLPYAPWRDLAHSGGHAWPLLDPAPCAPIPAKGRLGFWPVDGAA